ncbi:MAG TPA: hypothetical protein VJC11_01595, partial [Patescibacteria group bacterium]|nr:hypothetical protein [Patescibacteria group bacterium]
ERAFLVHPEVLAKDQSFRADSIDAEMAFSEIPPTTLRKMHDDFITACGEKKNAKQKTSKKKKSKDAVRLDAIWYNDKQYESGN